MEGREKLERLAALMREAADAVDEVLDCGERNAETMERFLAKMEKLQEAADSL